MFQISLTKGQSNLISFPLTIWCHQSINKTMESFQDSHADKKCSDHCSSLVNIVDQEEVISFKYK